MKDVLSVDFEDEVIEKMKKDQPEETKEALKYEKMDILDLKGV